MTTPVTTSETVTEPEAIPEAPSYAKRFGALMVDWILCLFVSGFFVHDLRTASWQPVVLLIAEYGFFVGLFAQTPGMKLARIRCVDFADGGAIGIPRAMLRGFLLCLVIPGLIMDGRRRRGLHDRAAGSVVVTAGPPQAA
ncbi:RDD family protein [Hamadaea tsunoensis]|uniref:RDD family protein n=1 Tax=Hamadaea tsunoensis TaxID=53368 RepID=UPI0009FCD5AC